VPELAFLTWDDDSGSSRTWTYAQFARVLAEVAGWLVKNGLKAGDGLHLSLPNSPAFVALWLASMRLGAWILPSDPQATAPELRHQASLAHPRLAICGPDSASAGESGAGHLGQVHTVPRSTPSSPPFPEPHCTGKSYP